MNAVGDLDDLRAALGYRKLLFDVASYGTFTALVYMREYPQQVESAVLQGIAPPGISNEAREFAYGAQNSLERLLNECDRDARCRTHFPHFRRHFFALLGRFNSSPVPVEVRNRATGRVETVALSREVFVDAVRHMLYDPAGTALLPLVVERAYRGNTLGLGYVVETVTLGYGEIIDWGAFLSYTCAEVMPFTGTPADLAYATDDPAAPAYEAKAELPYLSNGHLMLVHNAPHNAKSPCVDRSIERFIGADSAAGLRLDACSANFVRPPFATKLPVPLR